MKKLLLLASLVTLIIALACNKRSNDAKQKEIPKEEKVITHGNPDPGLVDSIKQAKTKGKQD